MKKFLVMVVLGMLMVSLSAIDLQTAKNMAKDNNKELQRAKEEIGRYEGKYKEVRGMLFPQIYFQSSLVYKQTHLPDALMPPKFNFMGNLNGTADGNDSLLAGGLNGAYSAIIPSKISKENGWYNIVKMDQVLFSGGKLINGIRAVDKIRSIQKLKYSITEQSIVLETEKQFYLLLLLQEVVKIQEQALITANQHLKHVGDLYKNGFVSEYDNLRAEIEVEKLKPQLLEAQNNLKLAEEAFKIYLGVSKEEKLVVDGEFKEPAVQDYFLGNCLHDGKQNRKEVELFKIYEEAYKIQLNAEKGNYLPVIGLTAEAGTFNKASDYSINGAETGTYYQVGVGMQIPLFTGLSNTAKITQARHQFKQAQYERSETTDYIELEIRQAYQDLENKKEKNRVQDRNIQLASKALKIAEQRYDAKIGTQLEIVDAQLQYKSVQLTKMQALYELIIANSKLKKAMGVSL